MPPQSSSWQEDRASLLGTRHALGVSAGMGILLMHMHSQLHKSVSHTRIHTPDPSPWERKIWTVNRNRTFSRDDHTDCTKAFTVADVQRSTLLSWENQMERYLSSWKLLSLVQITVGLHSARLHRHTDAWMHVSTLPGSCYFHFTPGNSCCPLCPFHSPIHLLFGFGVLKGN